MASKQEQDATASQPVVEEAQTTRADGSPESEEGGALERTARPRRRAAIARDDRRGRRPARRGRRRRWSEEDSDRTVDEGARLARSLAVGYLRQIELLSDITGSFAGSVIDATRDRDEPRRRRRPRDDDDRFEAEDRVVDEYDDYDYEDDYDDDYEEEDGDAPRAVRRRNGRSSRRRGPRRATDTFADLADDLYDGAVDAFRDLQDLPGDVVDEFYDSFDSYEPRRRRHARRR